ncbi:MAG: cpdB [Gemmatimonadetes bacterium]|nr:cpdB [Gemmatimonadota bacterium]
MAAAASLAAGACQPQTQSVPASTAPDQLDLVVVTTTDTHGRLRGWDYYTNAPDTLRGLTRAATIVDSVRAAHPGQVILLDAGDLLQGNPLAFVAARVATDQPHPVSAAMNAMHYDAAAIGNHEFNYGMPTLRRAVAEAQFPFLSANARTPAGARAFKAWTIVERGGVKVGIVGATTPGVNLWDRDNVAGQVVMHDVVPEVRTAVAEVKAAGAQVVIVSVHSGLDEPASYDTVSSGVGSENVAARIARDVPGIAFIVYGHSHKEVAATVINGVVLQQPKNWATSVGVAALHFTRGADGSYTRTGHTGTLVRAAGHAEQAAVLAATDAVHRATVAYATATIGRTAVTWRADSARVVDTPLIDFILEVERAASGADIASSAAFDISATLDSGAISVARIAALYPYDNTLRAVKISGAQLRAYLEHSARYYRGVGADSGIVDRSVPGYNFDVVSGVDYTLDLSKPLGQRVTTLTWKGRTLEAGDSLTMALNNYRQTGGGGFAMLAGAPLVYDKQQEIRQLLIDEVRRRGTISPADYFHPNWRIVPDAAIGAAYSAMRRDMSRNSEGATTPPRITTPGRDSAVTNKVRVPPLTGPRIRIIGTNDFHGALVARAYNGPAIRGGAANVATMIQKARAECAPPECESVLVDGGDLFQGTPASNLAEGRPVVDYYNAVGYVATAVGNHEWDWGREVLRARMKQAKFAFLAANVRDSLGRDIPWVRNDTLVTRGRYKIGIIGVATVETPTTTRSANVAGLRFVDPAPIVDTLARRLRARGADIVIVIAHAGAFCDPGKPCDGEIIKLANSVTEHIDAIVSGHTHTLINTVINGIPIVQARHRGQAVETLDVPAGATSGRTAVANVTDIFADSLVPDPAVQKIVDAAQAKVAAKVSRVVTVVAEPMPKLVEQFALANLVADGQRDAGQGDISLMNNGGVRVALGAGPQDYGAFFEIEPFANILYRLTFKGRDVRALVERIVADRRLKFHVSGITVHYDTTRAVGSRVNSITLAGGQPLVDDSTYALITSDFIVTGGDALGPQLKPALSVKNLNIVDLDALIAWVEKQPRPLQAPKEPRFIVDPPR